MMDSGTSVGEIAGHSKVRSHLYHYPLLRAQSEADEQRYYFTICVHIGGQRSIDQTPEAVQGCHRLRRLLDCLPLGSAVQVRQGTVDQHSSVLYGTLMHSFN